MLYGFCMTCGKLNGFSDHAKSRGETANCIECIDGHCALETGFNLMTELLTRLRAAEVKSPPLGIWFDEPLAA